MPGSIVVTTCFEPGEALIARAASVAERAGTQAVDRRGQTLSRLLRRNRADLLYIVGAERDELSDGAQKLFVHRGLPAKYQPSNPLLQALQPQPGQRIVDATLGLASDAQVIASTGALVIGIEADPLLFSLAERALPDSIELRLGSSESLLPELSNVGAVYLDPMFDEPRRAAAGFELLRARAHHSDRRALLAAARRVAPRVVMKTGRGEGGDLTPTHRLRGKACDYLVFDHTAG